MILIIPILIKEKVQIIYHIRLILQKWFCVLYLLTHIVAHVYTSEHFETSTRKERIFYTHMTFQIIVLSYVRTISIVAYNISI